MSLIPIQAMKMPIEIMSKEIMLIVAIRHNMMKKI